jgi:hypothetical protein
MSSDEEERILNKKIFKNPVEVQKARLDRLMNNMEKTVFIPERREIRPPRAFQPHEFVRNVMGNYKQLTFYSYCFSRMFIQRMICLIVYRSKCRCRFR